MARTIVESLIDVLKRQRAAGGRYARLSEESRSYLRCAAQAAAAPSPGQRARRSPGSPARPAPSVQPSRPRQPAVAADPPIGDLSLEELRDRVASCQLCPLCRERTQTVFGAGDPNADLMFVGEGPGRDEDRQGVPFVGAAGQLLTKMIQAMQFTRETVYIANIVKCRPPRNRKPEEHEALACLPYLDRQIQLLSPKVIVTLGAVPLQFLLGLSGISRIRGQWQEYNGIPVMPTFHPAFLLRAENRKADVWHDLQEVMKRFGKDPRQSVRKSRAGT